jgi:hypothetical protein
MKIILTQFSVIIRSLSSYYVPIFSSNILNLFFFQAEEKTFRPIQARDKITAVFSCNLYALPYRRREDKIFYAEFYPELPELNSRLFMVLDSHNPGYENSYLVGCDFV